MKGPTPVIAAWCVALAGVGFFGFAVLGCASQTGLLTPGVERVTLSTVNVVRGPREVVSARCVQGKQAWDDGSPYDPNDTSKWARCCTVYRKSRKKPFTIWITEGEEECFVHELCHVEQFLSPRTDHSKCHDFGLGKPKKRV